MLPDPRELASLLALYRPHIGGRLNVAVSATGEVSGASGTSDDVSNPLDRALLLELRKQADVVVTSGASVRAEKLRASNHVPIIVLTKAGSIAGLESILDVADRKAVTLFTLADLVIKLKRQLDAAGFENLVLGLSDLQPETVTARVQALGYEKLLFEFGPSLSAKWTTGGFVDEVCLTTTGVSEDFEPRLPTFIKAESTLLESTFYSQKTSTRFDRFQILKLDR